MCCEYAENERQGLRLVVIILILLIVVFTARCYASAVLAMALCLSVRPSVCPSVRLKSVFY